MAMMKLSFGLTVVSVALFLCLNISTPTEARSVKNDNKELQVNPGHLVNMKSVAPPKENSVGPPKEHIVAPPKEHIVAPPKENSVARPGNNTVPLKTVDIGQARNTKALNATASSAASFDVDDEYDMWCIAKPSTSDIQLDENIQFACTQGYYPFSCSTIQPGGNCYNPANRVATASVVMNLFFQSQGQSPTACYFNGSGLIVYVNPSTDASCLYPPYYYD